MPVVQYWARPYSDSVKEIRTSDAQAYDIIGDIHGHADELRALLETLGYDNASGAYCHPEGRKIIFLGDYIDRGPKIREVLETVRRMVDTGEALAILGNHEVNAMRYGTIGSDGQPLRSHTSKNTAQHQATLDQFPEAQEWKSWLSWFAGLPLWLDLGSLRAVHACWDDAAMTVMTGASRLEGLTLEKCSRKGMPGYYAISRLANGPEGILPEGFTHRTADGTMRSEFRVKWWMDLEGLTCREAIFPENPTIPDLPPRDVPRTGYPDDAPPTFFGHYAKKDPVPAPVRPNLACLDYGTGKGGFLCAYRWDGEQAIDGGKFVFCGNTEISGQENLQTRKIPVSGNHSAR